MRENKRVKAVSLALSKMEESSNVIRRMKLVLELFIFDWYSSWLCFFPWLAFDRLIDSVILLPLLFLLSQFKQCSPILFTIKHRRTKKIMGCVSSKKKLSKADLEFLEENTEFTKDQIIEWYEGFIVSEQFFLFLSLSLSCFPSCEQSVFSSASFSLVRLLNWWRFRLMRFLFLLFHIKQLYGSSARWNCFSCSSWEKTSQSEPPNVLKNRRSFHFGFWKKNPTNLSIFHSTYCWCQKTTTRITTSVWWSTSIEWVHTDFVCWWCCAPFSFPLIDLWWTIEEIFYSDK